MRIKEVDTMSLSRTSLGWRAPAQGKHMYLYYDSEAMIVMKRKEPNNVRICGLVKPEFDHLKNVFHLLTS